MSLRKEILSNFRVKYLRGENGYINGGAIERFALERGYKASNASRRLREMTEDGELEVDYLGKKKTASYRYIPTRHEQLSLRMKHVI